MARPSNNIGVFGDLDLGGTGNVLLADFQWMGDPSGSPSLATVRYPVGSIVTHNDQLWRSITDSDAQPNDNQEPTDASAFWESISGNQAEAVSVIAHNIEGDPVDLNSGTMDERQAQAQLAARPVTSTDTTSIIQLGELFLLDNRVYRRSSVGSISVTRRNFVFVTDTRDINLMYFEGTYFVLPGRYIVRQTMPAITGITPTTFPNLDSAGFELIALGEAARQGDIWIDEFDGRVSARVATTTSRSIRAVGARVNNINGVTAYLDTDTGPGTLRVSISEEEFNRLPDADGALPNISGIVTDANGDEQQFNFLKETPADVNDGPFFLSSLLTTTQANLVRSDAFPDSGQLAAPNRSLTWPLMLTNVGGGSWIQIGGLHVSGGADFDLGSFNTPRTLELNFGTFDAPAGPSLNLGGLS